MIPALTFLSLRKPLHCAAVSCLLVLFAAIVALVSSRPAAAQQSPGVDPFDPASASFFASPASVRPVQNKYPAAVPFILWLKGCTPGQTTGPIISSKSTFSITIAGAGLSTAAKPALSDCKLTTTLNIDAAAATSGYFLIDVVETTSDSPAKQVDRGNAILTLLDAAASPIPANQQVDVIWGVLSKDLCRDNFGIHVANDVFCIEVKIGNNSGHQIQLAGVGFQPNFTPGSSVLGPTPNISYQSVRASAQGYALWTPRTLLMNGSSAIGLLMATFNPFFHATYNIARWAAGTAVVASLPGVIGQIAPDLATRELNNLDDQTFRDGLLIPNNSQIRTMVFVERRLLQGTGSQYYDAACDAVYKSLPGGTVGTAKCKKKSDDPMAVKWALGRLVIVGEEIDFIQRVVVDSSATGQSSALNPIITDGTATTAAITLTFQGNAPTGATATISSTTDTNFSTAVALTADTTTKVDASTLIFDPPPGKSLIAGSYYIVVLSVPNVAPLTRIIQVPAATTSTPAPSTTPAPAAGQTLTTPPAPPQ